MSEISVTAKPYQIAKAGNLRRECDDAYWPRTEGGVVHPPYRIAVADGATESTYSRLWASILANAFCHGRLDHPTNEGVLADLGNRWHKRVATKELSWYAEEKARQGAYATLLGITLDRAPGSPRHEGKWSAVAVGDSCLVQIRGDEMLSFFPLARSEEFAARPHLLSSRSDRNAELDSHVRQVSGEWHSDDTFFLMTDALSCWFLTEVERGKTPWRCLRDFDTLEETISFADLVEELRESHSMKNDDVTLVRVDVTSHELAEPSRL